MWDTHTHIYIYIYKCMGMDTKNCSLVSSHVTHKHKQLHLMNLLWNLLAITGCVNVVRCYYLIKLTPTKTSRNQVINLPVRTGAAFRETGENAISMTFVSNISAHLIRLPIFLYKVLDGRTYGYPLKILMAASTSWRVSSNAKVRTGLILVAMLDVSTLKKGLVTDVQQSATRCTCLAVPATKTLAHKRSIMTCTRWKVTVWMW